MCNPYLDRVKKGAEWLDNQYMNDTLTGWRWKLNRELLNLGCCDTCVLGQLYGDYGPGRDGLGLSQEECVDMGFHIGMPWSSNSEKWRTLTEAWKEILR